MCARTEHPDVRVCVLALFLITPECVHTRNISSACVCVVPLHAATLATAQNKSEQIELFNVRLT